MESKPIDFYASTYQNRGSFANVKSFVRYVNRILELSPDDNVYPGYYEKHFKTIVCRMIKSEQYATLNQLISKLGNLTGLLNRVYTTKVNPLIQLVKDLNSTLTPLDFKERGVAFTAPPWDKICEDLKKVLIDSTVDKNAKVIAVCYLHENVLRVAEIFNTTLKKIEGFNHLDLESGTWTIYNHKNKLKSDKPRQFLVTEEFVNDIYRVLDGDTCPFLIHKDTLTAYTSSLTHHTARMPSYIPSNSECRNSYEQWSHKDSGRDPTEANWRSINILGHSVNTAHEHYTRNDTVIEINAELSKMQSSCEKVPVGRDKSGKIVGYYKFF